MGPSTRWLAGTAVTLFAGIATMTASAAAGPAGPGSQDPGEALFRGKGNCFTCHGPTAEGTPLAPDLTDDGWVNFEARPSQEQVEALIREGVARPREHPAPMPPKGGAALDDEEIAQLAAYVLSLSGG